MSAISKEISRVSVYGIPLGRLVLAASRLSPDFVTQQAVEDINRTNRETGILQLDAHRSQFDIMASMCALAKVVPDLEYAAGLMATKWSISFAGSGLKDSIDRQENLLILPVVRFEDSHHVSTAEFDQRKIKNQETLEKFLGFVNRPHAVGNIAAYGSRYNPVEEKYLKKGPVEMTRDLPYVISWSKYSPRDFGYRVYLSPLIKPEGDIPEAAVRTHIQSWFLSVRDRIDRFG